MKPLFFIHLVGWDILFILKVVFLFNVSQSKGYFQKKKREGDKHYQPNTIHLKLFHPYFKNGNLSGKFCLPLELSNGFLFWVIRCLKISFSKNHPVEEKWWVGLTGSLLAGRVPYLSKIVPGLGQPERKKPWQLLMSPLSHPHNWIADNFSFFD